MHGVGGQQLIFVNLVTMLGLETQKSILGREFQEVLVHILLSLFFEDILYCFGGHSLEHHASCEIGLLSLSLGT